MPDPLDHMDPLVDESHIWTPKDKAWLERKRLDSAIKRAEIRLKQLEKREKEKQ